MNKESIRISDYVMEELQMLPIVSKEEVNMDTEQAQNVVGLLVLSDTDANKSDSEKVLDAFEFITNNGGFEYFTGVESFEELADTLVQFDTENKENGYRAPVYGTLPEQWAKFIDKNKLAEELKNDDRVTFVPKWKSAIRVW